MTGPGRLIGVVGPSGVGKDSVMGALAAAEPRLGLVRRVITRAPGLGGEDYEPVSDTAFDQLRDAGAFCLHWQAHGLSYGIPAQTRAEVAAGAHLLVNLSRAVLPKAEATFARFSVLNITSTPQTLAARLAARGRESAADIHARLNRQPAALPSDLHILTIANDGPLGQTVTQALDALAMPKTAGTPT